MPEQDGPPTERLSGQAALSLALLVLLGGLFHACQADEPRSEAFEVSPGDPGTGTLEHPQQLFLNQRVVVFFTQALDPLSVTPDTVRLVKVKPNGEQGVVRLRRVIVRSRSGSVILEPEPPLTPTLDDGSLQPDQVYRLEIAGLPLTNTVRSLEGRPLRRHGFRYFRTVTAAARETDLPYPFLPPGASDEPFKLRERLVAAGGRLQLHFTLPVLPMSVRPDAFEVFRYRKDVDKLDATNKPPRVALSAARILSLPRPIDPHPGSTVELTFADPAAVGVKDQLWVRLRDQDGVLDYWGRPPTGPATTAPLPVKVHIGPKPPLLRLSADKALAFGPVVPGVSKQESNPDQHALLFECLGKWIQPLARREAGDGSLGVFHPKTSMVLEPGQPFELGNGQTVVTGTAFNFRAIHIPKGVTVTVRSQRRVQLRASGAVQIKGVLKLDTPAAEGKPQPVDLRSPATVGEYAPVALIAAGSIQVTGSIQRDDQPDGLGSPLAMVATGILLRGRIPRRTILAAPKGRVTGPAQDPIVVEMSMESGLPAGTHLLAEAYTGWWRLPENFAGKVLARTEGVEGDLEVFLTVAAADPADPDRPYLGSGGLSWLPLREAVQVPRDGYVCFKLRAQVVGGTLLPRLRALVVVAE
ncbi:MAG: hypothetical protein ACYTGW_08250 [Planctomycetota bacterium]|jgi:hypothetical protein